jgi:hypothetical protein
LATKRGRIIMTFSGGSVTIHSSVQTVSRLSYIEGITLTESTLEKVCPLE